MTTGSASRMVLHLHADYSTEFIKAEDVTRIEAYFTDGQEDGCVVYATELGVGCEYWVCEPYESVCDFIRERAPSHWERMRVSLVDEG